MSTCAQTQSTISVVDLYFWVINVSILALSSTLGISLSCVRGDRLNGSVYKREEIFDHHRIRFSCL